MKKNVIIFFVILSFFSDLSAQFTLVKDINPTGSGNPKDLVNVNGVFYFTADDGINGVELWKSDGTESGTSIVKDIVLGSISSFPHTLTNVNGLLFFICNDGIHGPELWRSDGTNSGTFLVKDINPGALTFHLK
jgi:ELWxxDGT repeat protein